MQTITGEVMAHWVEPETMSRYVVARVRMGPDDPDDVAEADDARLGRRSDSSGEGTEPQELCRHREGDAGQAKKATPARRASDSTQWQQQGGHSTSRASPPSRRAFVRARWCDC